MSRAVRVVILLLCLVSAFAPLVRAQGDVPPVNFTIAFIGDQGLGPDARAVLTLIRDEGANAVVHSGDLDYADDPGAWEDQINAILGPDFPYFVSVGNHDDGVFYGSGGYQERMELRMRRLGIPWQGDLGVQSSFRYAGIFFVLTAPDVFGAGDGDDDVYVERALAADDSIWRVSSWHKNMRLMQVGDKDDATGWGVYEKSRQGGAIIATAHEHSYSRTHLLSSCRNQTVASVAGTLVLSRDDPGTPADEGRSFVFVSGMGGRSIRDQLLSGAWWASIYTGTQGANFGALFGVFNAEGDPRLARFYFKDIDGRVADEFLVRSALGGIPPPPVSTTTTLRSTTSTTRSPSTTTTSTRVPTTSTTTSTTRASTSTRMTTSTLRGPVTLLLDDFTAGLDQWSESGAGGWKSGPLHSSKQGYPDNASGPPAAYSESCETGCTLTLARALDLRNYGTATLTLLRVAAPELGAEEYLQLLAWDGSAWISLATWSGDTDDSDGRWHRETHDLAPFLGVAKFRIRLVAFHDGAKKPVHVDDVVLTAR